MVSSFLFYPFEKFLKFLTIAEFQQLNFTISFDECMPACDKGATMHNDNMFFFPPLDGFAFSQEEGGTITQTDVIRAYDTNLPKPGGM